MRFACAAWVVLLALPASCALLFLSDAAAETGVIRYTCSGVINSENIFAAGSAVSQHQRFDIVVDFDKHYVKRDQQLAAGCLTRQIEICSCDLGAERIVCRSLGSNPRNGQEVAADFSIERSNGSMQFSGRQTDAEAGQLTESQGQLSCLVKTDMKE